MGGDDETSAEYYSKLDCMCEGVARIVYIMQQ